MDFEIYVLGDVRLFADTLNGIAMMFTVANGERIDLWASNTNGFGLGMGALLGIMFALFALIYNAAFKQKFDFATFLTPIILYIVLTVPKVTVNVVDAFYRDGAQTVDNVPIGLALPLTAISGIAFTATEKLETVFTVPNAGTFTKITEDGYVMPLKILHALRYTGLTMRDGYPNMNNSLIEIVKICLTNNPTFNLNEYQNSKDSLAVIINALNDAGVGARLVKIYPHTHRGGMVTRCDMAASYLRGTLQAYMDGTVGAMPSLVADNQVKQKNLRTDIEKILSTQNGNTGSRNVTNTSTVRVLDEIQNLTKASNDEALLFVQASIFNPQLSAASQCVNGVDASATARCLSYMTSEEQWKERSAAEASGFLGIMRDGQNLLILLSITLFPIMVLVIALQGMGGLKVVGSYLLYTISAYMWIPVAAMINWFTQVQLHEELSKWSTRLATMKIEGFLSLANAPLFYDAISKKLAVANNVMAAVPVICMGIFGGMLWSMNRLVDKMNPQSNFDPTANTPAALERGALAQVGDSVSFDGVHSAGKLGGLHEAETLQKVRERALTQQKALEHLDKGSQAASRAIGQMINQSKDVNFIHSVADRMMEQKGFTDQNQEGYSNTRQNVIQGLADFALAESIAQKTSLSQQDIKAASAILRVAAGVIMAMNPLQLAAKLQAVGEHKIAEKFGTDNNHAVGNSTTDGTTGSTIGKMDNSTGHSQSDTYKAASALVATAEQMLSEKTGYDNSQKDNMTAESLVKEARSELNAYGEADKSASSTKISMSNIATADKYAGGALSRNLEGVWEQYKNEAGVAKAYDENQKMSPFTATGATHNNDFLNKLDALERGGSPDAYRAAISALGGLGGYVGTNVNKGDIAAVGAGKNSVYENAANKTAHASTLTAPPTSREKIEGEAGARKGNTLNTMGSIEQAANQKPTDQGKPVSYQNQVKGQAQDFISDANKLEQDAKIPLVYDQKNQKGENVNYTTNDNLAGRTAKFLGDSKVASFVVAGAEKLSGESAYSENKPTAQGGESSRPVTASEFQGTGANSVNPLELKNKQEEWSEGKKKLNESFKKNFNDR